MKVFREDAGSSPPSLVRAASSGRQSGVLTTHARTGSVLGRLSPQMAPSEAVMLLCTAGPACGLPAELGLVKVSSSFIVLQGGMVMSSAVRVLPCFLFDGHHAQLG